MMFLSMYYLLYNRTLASREDSLSDVITLRGIGSSDEAGWSAVDLKKKRRFLTRLTDIITDDHQSYETVIAHQEILV